MRQHGDEGEPGAVVRGLSGGGLGHLHQREHAFLHPRAAAAADDDDGEPAGRRKLEGVGDLLADDRAHRAAHELEVEHTENRARALDARLADGHRLPQPRARSGLFQPVAVGALVGEAQGVYGDEPPVEFAE